MNIAMYFLWARRKILLRLGSIKTLLARLKVTYERLTLNSKGNKDIAANTTMIVQQ